jgi:hypothetical protein
MGLEQEIQEQKPREKIWAEVACEAERESINYYAKEMAYWQQCERENKDNEILSQWYRYFYTVSKLELEAANERLKEYRKSAS